MTARLTDFQKKAIVADYIEQQSYNAVGKKHGVAGNTVKRIVLENQGIAEKIEQKKEQNAADIMAHMDKQRAAVCGILDVGLEVLPEKIRNAKSASEVTTALGTLIDKWAALNRINGDTAKDDALSESLRTLAKELASDDQP